MKLKHLLNRTVLFLAFDLIVVGAHANLQVKLNEPKHAGSKAVIKLEIKNTFAEKVESARMQIFLMDDRGKVVGQGAQWVIGGTKDTAPLAPNATTAFHFVLPMEKGTSTNLTAKVSFTRVVLEGGRLVDVSRSVELAPATVPKHIEP
jgi:hypothetical protein